MFLIVSCTLPRFVFSSANEITNDCFAVLFRRPIASLAPFKKSGWYRASAHGLNELIATVSPTARVLLAVYCYRRAHLASIGLAIAATCDKDDLADWGGNAGAVLFKR